MTRHDWRHAPDRMRDDPDDDDSLEQERIRRAEVRDIEADRRHDYEALYEKGERR